MLRHLLREDSIYTDIREASFEEILKAVPERIKSFPSTFQPNQMMNIALRNGVSLSYGFSPDLSAPQISLMISRWGILLPEGMTSSLLFFLLLPDQNHSREIKEGLKREIERVICDRFILERVKISETSEEVLEVLLREHGFSKEVVLA